MWCPFAVRTFIEIDQFRTYTRNQESGIRNQESDRSHDQNNGLFWPLTVAQRLPRRSARRAAELQGSASDAALLPHLEVS